MTHIKETINDFVRKNISPKIEGEKHHVIDNNTGEKYTFITLLTDFGLKVKVDDQKTALLCLVNKDSFYSLI